MVLAIWGLALGVAFIHDTMDNRLLTAASIFHSPLVAVGGSICNPRNGFCESPGAVCIGSEAESPACLNRPGSTMSTSSSGPAGAGTTPMPLGVSPATGSVPPPPGTRP